jgi:hypothetical protein
MLSYAFLCSLASFKTFKTFKNFKNSGGDNARPLVLKSFVEGFIKLLSLLIFFHKVLVNVGTQSATTVVCIANYTRMRKLLRGNAASQGW